MSDKAQTIYELLQEKASEITQNEENWLAFLNCTAWMYKYSFKDQVLIFAQRPDATACATFDEWNDRIHRRIKRGSKGIALLDEVGNGRLSLRYVFDVTDTRSTEDKELKLWSVDGIQEELAHILRDFYDSKGQALNEVLIDMADKILNLTYSNNIDDEIFAHLNDSLLEQMPPSKVSAMFYKLIKDSIVYTAMKRCGVVDKEFVERACFSDIEFFDTQETIGLLGTLFQENNEIMLSKIRQQVQILSGKRRNHILAKSNENVHNVDKEERNNDYGRDYLQTGGELSLPQSGNGEAGESGQIRTVKAPISQGVQERNLLRTNSERTIERSPTGSGSGNSRNERHDNEEDHGAGTSTQQSVSTNRMGEVYEQPQTQGRRIRIERDHLQLDLGLKEENKGGEEEKTLPPFDMLDLSKWEKISAIQQAFKSKILNSNVIIHLLTYNEYLLKTSTEIVDFFKHHNNNEIECAQFIKECYPDDPVDWEVDGVPLGFSKEENHIHLYFGTYDNQIESNDYSWNRVARLVDGYILSRYYDPKVQIPTIEEIRNAIYQNKKALENGIFFSQEEVDRVLIYGSSIENGKYRIYRQFQNCTSLKENAEFLKNEYGWGGVSPLIGCIEETHSGKGITLTRGKEIGNPEIEITLSWNKVARRISRLIVENRYLNEKELEHYSFYIEKENIKEDKEIVNNAESVNIEKESDIDNIPKVYQWKVGDTVYIGTTEYEIIETGTKVLLQDKEFPLFNEIYTIEDLKSKLEENPLNDNLLVPMNLADGKQNEKTQAELYHEYFPIIERKIKESSIYPILRDRDTSINEAENLIETEITKIIDLMRAEHSEIYDLCANDEQFKKTMIDDLIERNYENYSIATRGLKRDIIDNERNNIVSAQKMVDIPKIPKINYRITDENLGVATPKVRYQNNINAIKLLKELEENGRTATEEEQEILAKYVGWGGISEAFDNTKDSWVKEYEELKELLSEEEYKSARESVLTAYYTPPFIIKSMYQVIENMGFKNGNILEPSCGTGNFMGYIPDTLKDSKVFGIEIDSISGRIAKQLYPKNNIHITGFEKADLSDSLFDAAIGNIPFGNYGLADSRYDKYHFQIHEYFFAKALDKVRTGGIIAFIASAFMMDKHNSKVRSYISERAEFLGAIRLPNTAFKGNAGTKVVSDIIFLKKRTRPIISHEEWLTIEENKEGIKINSYYVSHPEMILGKLKFGMGMYGRETITVEPYDDIPLKELLQNAIVNIKGEITEVSIEDVVEEERTSIPADPNVKNFSFTVLGNEIYYRENSLMYKVDVSKDTGNRIKAMITLRESVNELLRLQVENFSDEYIHAEQKKLNDIYDDFILKYGLINDRKNAKAFDDDDSYYLLAALEILNDDGTLKRKSDIFTKRTVNPKNRIERVDNANEALMVSLNEYGKINFAYMSELTGFSKERLIRDLKGIIYKLPNVSESNQEATYVLADEYLSGNIREKLRVAELSAEIDSFYNENVEALKKAMPKPLKASEIGVRIGVDWIPIKYYNCFIYDILNTPFYKQVDIKVRYSKINNHWNISSKNLDYDNVKAMSVYGTKRKNAYTLIEDCLNLKDTEVYDKIIDEDGQEKSVKNVKETILAQQKQDMIKEAFKEWLWKDYKRRTTLEELYNQKFNSIRPREYHGDHLTFPSMNPEINLRKHQKDAVAHVLYGGNTLLAHVVGAGKTYEMIAACMELKRLKMCNKPLFIVPKHLVEQWASDFLKLYPSADILVTREKDFKQANRKRFCSRIATGDYDAIIMGHTTFEKIPMSLERQIEQISTQINEIEESIKIMKEERAERYTIKQMERTKQRLKNNLEKLNNRERKDDVITFEELGVDRLFVDESHTYKNLFTYTKMSNIGGITTAPAQRSSDLFLKVRYLDEITGGKGTVFATGTPISNSMVELYSIQRYLQYDTLEKQGLLHFDSWATVFGETTNTMELSPEGNYRYKKRFSKFYNLPELMNVVKEIADIKVASDLHLPIPQAEYINVSAEASDIQQDVLQSLVKRAEKVRNGNIDPTVDNMLKITNDGRKLALDQRLFDMAFPDHAESKVNQCIENVYRIWEDQKDKKSTQIIFSDLSTPANKEFNLYNDIKGKLLERGVPEHEIAFIHDYKTDKKKKQLFKQMREGAVRILLGSTSMLGTGSNIQTLLYAIHDLDIPWTPLAFEQRLGRIVRQGNMNEKVQIYRYVTKGTFDAYTYQLVENKQRYISQIMTNKVPVRSFEDVDTEVISFGTLKALASGNPLIMEKMELEEQIQRLKLAKSDFLSQKYMLEDRVMKYYPYQIKRHKELLELEEKDNAEIKPQNTFEMTIKGIDYTDKKKAGNALLLCVQQKGNLAKEEIGAYRSFQLFIQYNTLEKEMEMVLKRNQEYIVAMGTDAFGNITRLDNAIADIANSVERKKAYVANLEQQLKNTKEEIAKPFDKEQELSEKLKRLSQIDKELGIKDNYNKKNKKIIEVER